MPAKRQQPEFELQAVVVALLRFRARAGLFWFHPPNGEKRSPRTGARLKRMGVVAGVPDLVLIWQKRAIGLELKAEGSYQNAEQRAVELAWTKAGGAYFCAKGYKAAVGFLTLLDCIKPIHDDDTRFIPRDGAAV